MNDLFNVCHFLSFDFDQRTAFAFYWFKKECATLIEQWSNRVEDLKDYPPIFMNIGKGTLEWVDVSDENLNLYRELVNQQIEENNVARAVSHTPHIVC